MLPARHRLRDGGDFAAAVRRSRAGGRLVVAHIDISDARRGLPARVGFVVSKAVGNAVHRNRTKRRLRALMVTRLDALPDGADVVIRANPAAAAASYAELGEQVDAVVARAAQAAAQPRRSGRRRS